MHERSFMYLYIQGSSNALILHACVGLTAFRQKDLNCACWGNVYFFWGGLEDFPALFPVDEENDMRLTFCRHIARDKKYSETTDMKRTSTHWNWDNDLAPSFGKKIDNFQITRHSFHKINTCGWTRMPDVSDWSKNRRFLLLFVLMMKNDIISCIETLSLIYVNTNKKRTTMWWKKPELDYQGRKRNHFQTWKVSQSRA